MKTNDVDEVILFHKVKNEMPASAAAAPYLGKIEPRGALDEDTFIGEMCEDGCTESPETIRRILRGADAVQARRIGEKGNKVQTGTELMMPHLTGTLPTPDATPGDDNALTVRIDPNDGLRNALSDLTPRENRENLSKLGGVRIYSVKSEGLDWSELKGTQPFQIAGIGFRPTATATVDVKVVNRKTGDEATATATCEDNQRIVAQLGSALAKGDYKVVVTVTDEGGLSGNREASWNVKMLFVPVPVPVPIAQSKSGDIKIMEMDAVSASGPWDIRGVNVGFSNEGEPNGLVNVSAEIEGKTVDWANFSTHFEDASATFKPTGSTDLPPGEYVADLTFMRVGGSEGGESIVVRNATITVA